VKGKLILSVIDNIYKMDGIIKEALKDLKIGESKIEFEGDSIESNNIQSVLLQEIKEKLYGKEVKASNQFRMNGLLSLRRTV
jgi:hypothetical protein